LPYASNGARGSEIEGAMLNAQLDRIKGLLLTARRQKKQILRAVAGTGLVPSPCNSLDYECGTNVMFKLPDAATATKFAKLAGGGIAGKTGRHTYNEWDPILKHQGAHHPAMNPFLMPANRRCRMKYSMDMLPRSLEILNRTVMIGINPDRNAGEVQQIIRKITAAARAVL
jgi:hypothetical protein